MLVRTLLNFSTKAAGEGCRSAYILIEKALGLAKVEVDVEVSLQELFCAW